MKENTGLRSLLGAAASMVAAIAALSMLIVMVSPPPVNAETPAERCKRETTTYNNAWKNSWAQANPGKSPSQAPPPPVPYKCGGSNDGPPPTVAPTTTSPEPRPEDVTVSTPKAPSGEALASVGPNLNPPTTSVAPATPNSGAVIGGDAGPRPGQGNGGPIIGREIPTPGEMSSGRAAMDPTVQVPATVMLDGPGRRTIDDQGPIRPPVPSGAAVAEPGQGSTDQAYSGPTSESRDGSIPLPVWLIVGAVAVAAARPRTRQLLSRGGSTRATVGSSDLVLIHDGSSPDRYVFDEDLPAGGRIRINSDGSATVLNADGQPVRNIGRPWAFDAAGRPQKTWYEVDENGDLVQVVEPSEDVLYPILADPPGDTGGGLIAPTTGDNGADISAMPDTAGKQAGDTWTENRGGQEVRFTIPEGNGNQSVDMTYKNSDGRDSTARIVDDGEGGYQAWAQAADGTAQYIDKDGPEAPGYSQWYQAGNDPAYNSPNQITEANHNFTEATTYNYDNGSITDSQLASDSTYVTRTEYPSGVVDTAVSARKSDGSYTQSQTSHMDAGGENGWIVREDGSRWDVHRGEDEFGRPLIESENSQTGESEILFYDPDGRLHIQRFDRGGSVTEERVFSESGGYTDSFYKAIGDGAIPRRTGQVSYDNHGNAISGEYEDGENIVHVNPDGTASIRPKDEPGFWSRLGKDVGNIVMFVPRSMSNTMHTAGNPYAPNSQEKLTYDFAGSIANVTYRPVIHDLGVLSDVVSNSFYGPVANSVKSPTRPYNPPPGTEHGAVEVGLAVADLAILGLPVAKPIGGVRGAGTAARVEGAVTVGDLVAGRSGAPLSLRPGDSTLGRGLPPSSPVGNVRINDSAILPPSRPVTIDGIRFSGHAVDRLRGRGIPPTAAIDAIRHGESYPGRGGATVYYSKENHISVVVNSSNGRVITVEKGRASRGN